MFGCDSSPVQTAWMTKRKTWPVGDYADLKLWVRLRLWLLHQLPWMGTHVNVLLSNPVVEGLRGWCLTYTEDVRNCSH